MTIPRLADFEPREFLGKHWQRSPLVSRGALALDPPPISADELAGLALEEEVESRIVTGGPLAGDWTLSQGPFDEEDFTRAPERNWTLLVQAVDLFVPAVRALRDAFDFLPPWRIDDIMVSYAAPGGSVGPHFDFYDVFLLQLEGEREWRIGDFCDRDTSVDTSSGLKLLEHFEARESWVLGPGDMLYLPPRIGHWGVATSSCLTCSIGFRAPTLAEMLGDLATELMARGDDRFWRDPPLTPEMASEEIDPAFVEQAARMLTDLAGDRALLSDWFARYMTVPKYPELDLQENRRARIGGVHYVDGDSEDPPGDDRRA